MAIAAKYRNESRGREESACIAPKPTRVTRPSVRSGSASLLTEDFFSTSMPWLMLGVTILPFVVLLVWLVVAYFGIEYGTPPWNTHSVPPPKLY